MFTSFTISLFAYVQFVPCPCSVCVFLVFVVRPLHSSFVINLLQFDILGNTPIELKYELCSCLCGLVVLFENHTT